MKEVIYTNRKREDIFVLTEKEFQEAQTAWKNKKNYWCDRLEVLMPPNIYLAKTPDDEQNRGAIYVDPLSKQYRRYVINENTGKIYEIDYIKGGNTSDLIEVNMPELVKKRLIKQDDYFDDFKCYWIERDNFYKLSESKIKAIQAPVV